MCGGTHGAHRHPPTKATSGSALARMRRAPPPSVPSLPSGDVSACVRACVRGSAMEASAGGGAGGAAGRRWYFSREQLERSPSRRAGLDPDKELSYRQQAANLIQDMGQRLNVYPGGAGAGGGGNRRY